MMSTALFFSLAPFLFLSLTPINMIVSILMSCVFFSMNLWVISSSPWNSFIIMMVFLGGMMILFMYVVSVMDVKANKTKNKVLFLFMFVMVMILAVSQATNNSNLSTVYSHEPNFLSIATILLAMALFSCTKIMKTPFKALKSAF